jgi:transcription antitermination factor NusG
MQVIENRLAVAAQVENPLAKEPSVRNWYALYVVANHEKRVEQHLRMKDIKVFLPLASVEKRWKNRVTAKLEIPLFTGYVFACMAHAERIRALQVPRVVSIVGTGGKPTPLPESEIEVLRDGLHLRRVDPCPYLNVGKRARIRSGPLTGLEGVVVRRDSHLRIVLSVDLIMRSISVQVDADELELCPPDSPHALQKASG